MFVLVQVSSMKISLPASSVGWFSRHSARALATSGRSCSAARSDFFERQAKQLQRVPDQPDARCDLVRRQQPRPQFRDRGDLRVRPTYARRSLCRYGGQLRHLVARAVCRTVRLTRRAALATQRPSTHTQRLPRSSSATSPTRSAIASDAAKTRSRRSCE